MKRPVGLSSHPGGEAIFIDASRVVSARPGADGISTILQLAGSDSEPLVSGKPQEVVDKLSEALSYDVTPQEVARYLGGLREENPQEFMNHYAQSVRGLLTATGTNSLAIVSKDNDSGKRVFFLGTAVGSDAEEFAQSFEEIGTRHKARDQARLQAEQAQLKLTPAGELAEQAGQVPQGGDNIRPVGSTLDAVG